MELGREGSVPAACTEGLFYFYAGENVHSGDSCVRPVLMPFDLLTCFKCSLLSVLLVFIDVNLTLACYLIMLVYSCLKYTCFFYLRLGLDTQVEFHMFV